jgi:hypothetical protein
LIPGVIIMTAKVKHVPATTSLAPVVLFGIDSHGKPKGARFGQKDADLALKAASQLQLKVLASDDPKIAEIAARLPVGRVHGTGRTFVPFIRRDLYDKLVAAAPNGNSNPTNPPSSGSSGAPGSTARNWQEIGIGDLVVAQEGPEDGWYEAIVVECNNDMLTLRWRDYPRERRIVRHRNRLGLLHPATKPTAATGKSPKPTAAAKEDKVAAALPHDWQEIDINHLVLAKADGPWGAWWEAVPAEKTGDGFKLRWRDNHANVPPITRSRFELALICPDAM